AVRRQLVVQPAGEGARVVALQAGIHAEYHDPRRALAQRPRDPVRDITQVPGGLPDALPRRLRDRLAMIVAEHEPREGARYSRGGGDPPTLPPLSSHPPPPAGPADPTIPPPRSPAAAPPLAGPRPGRSAGELPGYLRLQQLLDIRVRQAQFAQDFHGVL